MTTQNMERFLLLSSRLCLIDKLGDVEEDFTEEGVEAEGTGFHLNQKARVPL